MKKTLYTPLLTAALLLAASCANDPVEEILNPSVPGTHLPGDTFIIDYAASTGEADTRADANQRIQSLDYLVYQSTDGGTTYTLLKRRAIPDINSTTKWPLTRGTMTWAQREALKDTLNTSCMYKMVFVANAADWIWDNRETDHLKGSSTIVLLNANLPTDETEAPTFDEGRLILPPRVFTEKDMYYMWSNHDAPVNGADFANGDKIHYMDITLKRMINKVEVKLDASLVTSGNVEEDIENYLDNYLETALAENGVIFEDLETTMVTFSNNFEIPLPAAETNFKNYVKDTKQINRILGNTETEDEQSIRKKFITTFKQKMTDEKKIKEKLKWNEIDKIRITYQNKGYASSITFDTQSKTNTSSDTDPIEYTMEEDDSFIFYAFRNNETKDGLNKFNTFSFLSLNGNESLSEQFSLSGTSITNYEVFEGNRLIKITCDPFSGINSDETFTYNISIDFEKFLDWNEIKGNAPATITTIKNAVETELGGTFIKSFTLTCPCNPIIKWNVEIQQ